MRVLNTEQRKNIMEVTNLLTLILGNAAIIIPLFIWIRTESRNDWRHMDAKMETYMYGIRQDIKAMHEEMKDFHARLCVIEERSKK